MSDVSRFRRTSTTPIGPSGKRATFLFPVTTNAADITALMLPRLYSVYIGESSVSSLIRLNDLFKVTG